MTQKRTNTQSLFLYVWMLAGIWILGGCDSRDYLAQQTFDKVCWSYESGLEFSMDLQGPQVLPLLLKVSPEYGYQNIYLKLSYTNSEGQSKEMLLNESLSDKLGNWMVELKGGSYEFELSEAFEVEIEEPGTYQFSLTQYMREENLCGIEKVGIIRP